LVGKGLKGQAVVSCSEGAGQAIAGAVELLFGQEEVDGLVEAAQKQALMPFERHQADGRQRGLEGQVKAVEGVQEEQGPDALVEVVAVAAEAVEVGTLG